MKLTFSSQDPLRTDISYGKILLYRVTTPITNPDYTAKQPSGSTTEIYKVANFQAKSYGSRKTTDTPIAQIAWDDSTNGRATLLNRAPPSQGAIFDDFLPWKESRPDRDAKGRYRLLSGTESNYGFNHNTLDLLEFSGCCLGRPKLVAYFSLPPSVLSPNPNSASGSKPGWLILDREIADNEDLRDHVLVSLIILWHLRKHSRPHDPTSHGDICCCSKCLDACCDAPITPYLCLSCGDCGGGGGDC